MIIQSEVIHLSAYYHEKVHIDKILEIPGVISQLFRRGYVKSFDDQRF